MNRWPANLIALSTSLFLGLFLLWPIGLILGEAFTDPQGRLTLIFLKELLINPGYLQGLRNSVLLAAATALLSLFLALPLALLATRHDFAFKRALSALVLVPMILPPFVGAIGLRQILSKEGVLNALLRTLSLLGPDQTIDWLGQSRFWGVVCANALHLYPILYLNLVAALSNIDPAMEQAAENLGCRGLNKFRRILWPLMGPGLFAGATLVFLGAFTDLGVPLMFDYSRVIPVQIFVGIRELSGNPFPYALVTLSLVSTVGIYWAGKLVFGKAPIPGNSKASLAAVCKPATFWKSAFCILAFSTVIAVALLPHLGMLLVSFSGAWSHGLLPQSWTFENYLGALESSLVVPSIANSLKYAALSTGLDVVLGTAIAWVVVRSKSKLSQLVDLLSMLPLAIPGLVLAVGYLAMTREGSLFSCINPAEDPTILLVVAYSIRRLPYVVRAAIAGLHQTSESLEEAAQNLGASVFTCLRRISLPLIFGNLIAGALLAFCFAMLEVSDSLLLAHRQIDFPITKSIYELFQLLGQGRYIASALGVWAMLFLTLTICAASALLGKKLGSLFRI